MANSVDNRTSAQRGTSILAALAEASIDFPSRGPLRDVESERPTQNCVWTSAASCARERWHLCFARLVRQRTLPSFEVCPEVSLPARRRHPAPS